MIPKTGSVVVQFGAPWCQPCKAIKPYVEGLARGVQAQFLYMNIEDHHELASSLNIRAMPTILAIKDGVEVGRINGANQGQIRNVLTTSL